MNEQTKNFKSKKAAKYGKRRTNKSAKCNSTRDSQDNSSTFSGSNAADRGNKYTSKTNDISWYNKNPGLLRDSCSINYGAVMGYPVHYPTAVGGANATLTAPGIAILDYVHGISDTVGYGDTVNIAAKMIYAKVRKYNSGSANYDPNDMMMYILAINEIFVMYSHVARAYGVLNTFDAYSNYQPKKLINALGFDYYDFIQHQPQIRALLDSVSARISVYAVPSDLSFIARQYWIPSGIYRDATTNKSQLFAYRPVIYRVYDETAEDGSLKLIAKLYPYANPKGTLLTYSAISSMFNEMLTAITESEFCGIISGDIRKAYESNVWSLGALDPNYTVLPSYDTTVLSQIENATIMGGVNGGVTSLNIYTTNKLNESKINYFPEFKIDPSLHELDPSGTDSHDPRTLTKLLTCHVNETTPEFTMEATRMCAVGLARQGLIKFFAVGTEFVCALNIYSGDTVFQYGSSVDLNTVNDCKYPNTTVMINQHPWIEQGNMNDKAMRFLQAYNTFDWAPQVTLMDAALNLIPLIDLDNYAMLDTNELYNMHNAAILSLFNLTDTGK